MPRRAYRHHAALPAVEPLPARLLLAAEITEAEFANAHAYGPGDEVAVFYHRWADPHPGDSLSVSFMLSADRVPDNGDEIYIGQEEAYASGSASSRVGAPPGAYYGVVMRNSYRWGINRYAVSDRPVAYLTRDPMPAGPIMGTDGDDLIGLYGNERNIVVGINGVYRYLPRASAPGTIVVDARGGDDRVAAANSFASIEGRFDIPLAITGSGGRDTIKGGHAGDELSGGSGRDRVFGAGGADYVLGKAGRDWVHGDQGGDTLAGGAGDDILIDHEGANLFRGDDGNDRLGAQDFGGHDVGTDTLFGGDGTDTAFGDEDDLLDGIETHNP
jgi:Ca2+-binding RTX toxin-like protein